MRTRRVSVPLATAAACRGAAVAAVAAVCATAACSSPEPADTAPSPAPTGDTAPGAATPTPVYRDLDLDTNEVELVDGLTYTVSDVARAVSERDGTPYVGFDVTVTNTTGAVHNPDSVNLHATYGPQGTATDVVIDPANGVGTADDSGAATGPEFGATIPHGEEVTVRWGYEVPPDVERVEIRIQPWDVDGAADAYLTGPVPAA